MVPRMRSTASPPAACLSASGRVCVLVRPPSFPRGNHPLPEMPPPLSIWASPGVLQPFLPVLPRYPGTPATTPLLLQAPRAGRPAGRVGASGSTQAGVHTPRPSMTRLSRWLQTATAEAWDCLCLLSCGRPVLHVKVALPGVGVDFQDNTLKEPVHEWA